MNRTSTMTNSNSTLMIFLMKSSPNFTTSSRNYGQKTLSNKTMTMRSHMVSTNLPRSVARRTSR